MHWLSTNFYSNLCTFISLDGSHAPFEHEAKKKIQNKIFSRICVHGPVCPNLYDKSRTHELFALSGRLYMKLIVAAPLGRQHRVSRAIEGACAGEGSQPPKLEPGKAIRPA